MKKAFILLFAVMFSLCTSVFAADISGDWTVEFTDIMGQQKWDVNIKASGENLDVAVKNAQGEMTGTGTLKGDQILITVVQKGGGGDMFIDFKGTVKGNKMEGTRELYADPNGEGYTGGARPGSEGSSDQASSGRGGAPADGQGGAPAGVQQGGGAPPSGGQGGAPAGDQQGGGAPPSGGQGGAPGGQGGAPGGQAQGGSSDSDNLAANTWTASKK